MPEKNNVTRMLEAKGIPYYTHTVPAEKLSALEIAELLNLNPKRVFKTIVLQGEKGKKGLLAVIPATGNVHPKKAAQLVGMKKTRVTTMREAETLTGLLAGGISPLALINKGFRVLLDESALRCDTVYLSGGKRGLQIEMKPDDLIRLTKAQCGALVSQAAG